YRFYGNRHNLFLSHLKTARLRDQRTRGTRRSNFCLSLIRYRPRKITVAYTAHSTKDVVL
ncbi:uncharacterized, partial [Tachysurus ichikawai]